MWTPPPHAAETHSKYDLAATLTSTHWPSKPNQFIPDLTYISTTNGVRTRASKLQHNCNNRLSCIAPCEPVQQNTSSLKVYTGAFCSVINALARKPSRQRPLLHSGFMAVLWQVLLHVKCRKRTITEGRADRRRHARTDGRTDHRSHNITHPPPILAIRSEEKICFN